MSGTRSFGGLSQMSCHDIAKYLSSQGISPVGVHAVQENQVDGEVFTELTDNDIKDLFSIFKDRHLVRKILQGKDKPSVLHQQVEDADAATSSGYQSTHSGVDSVIDLRQRHACESSKPAIHEISADTYIRNEPDIQSYGVPRVCNDSKSNCDNTRPSSSKHLAQSSRTSYGLLSAYPLTSESYFPSDLRYSSSSKHSYPNSYSHEHYNKELPKSAATSNTQEHFADGPRPAHQPVSFSSFISQDKAQSSLTVENRCQSRSENIWLQGLQDLEMKLIPTVLTQRLHEFSAGELLSKKSKQGKPSEAQRLGQMVIRDASSRAGIWDDPPCFQLLNSNHKKMFFHFAFQMAPHLRDHADMLWRRLGEALMNRRKYIRDKVMGKRDRRCDFTSPGDDQDFDYATSPDESENIEEQVPDTSTSPLQSKEDNNRFSVQWTGIHPSPLVSDADSANPGCSSKDEDTMQTYPDSTMDCQTYIKSESRTPEHQMELSRSSSFLGRHQNLSLLSSAALIKEEAERGFKRRYSDEDSDEEGYGRSPPPDIEKVNLHKRLFTAKYPSPLKHHHHHRTERHHNPNIDTALCQTSRTSLPSSVQDTIRCSSSVPKEQGQSIFSHSENPGIVKRFIMEGNPEIYSTIDRAISHYTGEELLSKKSKQGKPTEPQRLGQQVIRESAMMAGIWQDVPLSIRSITEDQKSVFFQCAFTLAPNLMACKNLVWRRLGEALQNRRKYVRDRNLGKRPTKREQRLMKEAQIQHDIETDSQASLSSIQDIEKTINVKSEHFED